MIAPAAGNSGEPHARARSSRHCPVAKLRVAAVMRACGSTWAEVAARVKKSQKRVEHWPSDYPDEWAEASRAAADEVRAKVAQAGAAALQRQESIATNAIQEVQCPRCRGRGKVVWSKERMDDCERCGGKGTIRAEAQRVRQRANADIMGLWGKVLPGQMELSGAGGEGLTYEQAMTRLAQRQRERAGERKSQAEKAQARISRLERLAGGNGSGGNGNGEETETGPTAPGAGGNGDGEGHSRV